MKSIQTKCIGAAMLFCMAAAVHAQTIYHQTFTGDAVPLNGTAPTLGVGMWEGTSGFRQDGAIDSGGGDYAFLEFTPETGKIYELSVSTLVNVSDSATWVSFGFFSINNHYGEPYQFLDTPNTPVVLRYNSTVGANEFQPTGAQIASDVSGSIRIILDTTSTEWTISTYLAGDNAAIFSHVYTAGNPNIGYIGFSTDGVVTGSISELNLQVIPEPVTNCLVLLGCALAGVCQHLRQRRNLI